MSGAIHCGAEISWDAEERTKVAPFVKTIFRAQ